MGEPKPRSWTRLIPVTGIMVFVLLASLVSSNIFVFYIGLFVWLIFASSCLILAPGPDAD